MCGAVEYPADLEPVLANAVSLGRVWLLEKKRYEEVKKLDEAINRYKQFKINKL